MNYHHCLYFSNITFINFLKTRIQEYYEFHDNSLKFDLNFDVNLPTKIAILLVKLFIFVPSKIISIHQCCFNSVHSLYLHWDVWIYHFLLVFQWKNNNNHCLSLFDLSYLFTSFGISFSFFKNFELLSCFELHAFLLTSYWLVVASSIFFKQHPLIQLDIIYPSSIDSLIAPLEDTSFSKQGPNPLFLNFLICGFSVYTKTKSPLIDSFGLRIKSWCCFCWHFFAYI